MHSYKEFFYEQILGATEGITIQHVGNVKATVDTGNSGYNVLHAIIIDENDDKVKFKTVNDKILELSVKERITVSGNNNTNERPVVLLDCSIGQEQFNQVPFSLADRSQQDTPVLLSKDFIRLNGGVVNVNINEPKKQDL
jgi:hypothetical protein